MIAVNADNCQFVNVVPGELLTLAAAWSARLGVCESLEVEIPREDCIWRETFRWVSKRHWHRRHTLSAAC
jgi:hypothetical protein